MLDCACIDWLSLFCEFARERIAGSVLDFASWHVFPVGMRLNKRVNNGGSGSVLADWLIDCVGALFVCEFDLNLFHLILIRLRDLYRISMGISYRRRYSLR